MHSTAVRATLSQHFYPVAISWHYTHCAICRLADLRFSIYQFPSWWSYATMQAVDRHVRAVNQSSLAISLVTESSSNSANPSWNPCIQPLTKRKYRLRTTTIATPAIVNVRFRFGSSKTYTEAHHMKEQWKLMQSPDKRSCKTKTASTAVHGIKDAVCRIVHPPATSGSKDTLRGFLNWVPHPFETCWCSGQSHLCSAKCIILHSR